MLREKETDVETSVVLSLTRLDNVPTRARDEEEGPRNKEIDDRESW